MKQFCKGMYALLFIIVLFCVYPAQSQVVMDDVDELNKIDVDEHLGEIIPLQLEFFDEDSNLVKLQDYFKEDRPVLLTLAYYECPMLCTFVLNGVTQSAYKLAFTPGNEYQILTVSIDPGEGPELAGSKKRVHWEAYNKPILNNGWDFLVGKEENIKKLADAVGFKYYYDPDRDEYAHPAVSYILTPDGKISRYLYGLEYKEQDLRLALLEASDGKIGDTLDKILLYCYHYDPDAKGYVVFAGNVMKLGGVITIIVLGSFLLFYWRREIRGTLTKKIR